MFIWYVRRYGFRLHPYSLHAKSAWDSVELEDVAIYSGRRTTFSLEKWTTQQHEHPCSLTIPPRIHALISSSRRVERINVSDALIGCIPGTRIFTQWLENIVHFESIIQTQEFFVIHAHCNLIGKCRTFIRHVRLSLSGHCSVYQYVTIRHFSSRRASVRCFSGDAPSPRLTCMDLPPRFYWIAGFLLPSLFFMRRRKRYEHLSVDAY